MKYFILLIALTAIISCNTDQTKIKDIPEKNNIINDSNKADKHVSPDTNAGKNGVQAEPNNKQIKNVTLIPAGSIPHDNNAFVQGLFYHDGLLYESTGEYGFSTIRKIDPKTGDVLKKISVGYRYFGEGIALNDNKIYAITWKSGVCNVYDAGTLQYLKSFSYVGEGWGITNYGNKLIMSDGTSTLKIINPIDFTVGKSIDVIENGTLLINLNEMENVKGEIWSNIWYEDRIVRIDPATGNVLGSLDFSFLRADQARNPRVDVLNGIAFDNSTNTLYITGKDWDKIYIYKAEFQY